MILLIAISGKEVLTVGILNFYTSGSRNEAAALGFILLVLGGVCLFVINKIAGASKIGGVFG